MKDTIKINFAVLNRISKWLETYSGNIQDSHKYMTETEAFLNKQDGSAVEALIQRSTEIKEKLQIHCAEIEVLKGKIDSSSEAMRGLLSPVWEDSAICVRLSSVAQFLETVNMQLAMAFAMPPINPTSEDYSYWVSDGIGGGHYTVDQWRYDNEEENGSYISSITNTDKTDYYDICQQSLSNMQSIYDNNIVPFFNLDNRLGGEFSDVTKMAEAVDGDSISDFARTIIIGFLIMRMIIETRIEKAKELNEKIASMIVEGLDATFTGEIPSIPFPIGDAWGVFIVDLKLKTNNPGATGEIEVILTDQLEALRYTVEKSGFLIAGGTDGIDFGVEVAGVNVTFDLSNLQAFGIFTARFETEPVDTDLFTLATSIEISKKFPDQKPQNAVQTEINSETIAPIIAIGAIIGLAILTVFVPVAAPATVPAMIAIVTLPAITSALIEEPPSAQTF
jgi:hypothetical protein